MERTYKARKCTETTRFPYEPLMREMLKRLGEDEGRETLSDKIAASLCQMSERQIRQMRLEGGDPFQIDHACCVGLGIHPRDLYGDEWFDSALRTAA